jgi:hypothetical protein
MKNNINLIIFVMFLFFSPFFAKGGSTERKSSIQEIKEKITKEKEKLEEKSEEREKKEVKQNDKYKNKDKNEVKKTAEEESRIKQIKDKIVKETKKIEKKSEEKDKYDYVYKRKNKHVYNGRDYKKKYKGYYYPSIYWIYDDAYYDVIYDDYTYVDDSDLIFGSTINTYTPRRRIAFLTSSVEAAYLGKDIRDTYGVTAKISANLYSLHFNCFYQNIFSSEEKLTIYSVNGGVSFALSSFALMPFIGAFYIEPLEEARLSYGANLQIFFPDNFNLDLYTINSSYGSLNFNNFSASLNRGFYRFNVGLGFNYNNYAGVNLSGPLVRFSFWL